MQLHHYHTMYPIIKIYDKYRESSMCEIIKGFLCMPVLCQNYIESMVSLLGKYNLKSMLTNFSHKFVLSSYRSIANFNLSTI